MTTTGRSCVVCGLGAIGSHTAMLVARLPQIGRVILVDFDTVEKGNLPSQSVRASDIGRPKAVVIARQLRMARPDLEVLVHPCRLEDVPLGELRADAILGCLDSRASRMAVNERAVALGLPLIDAAVSASGLLVRVSVCGSGGVCLECNWPDEAYASVEAIYACDGSRIAASPTAAPAFLGATAASLQAARFSAILSGGWDGRATETVLDAANQRLLVSSVQARATCRLAPHEPWEIERLPILPARLALAEAFDLVAPSATGVARSIEISRGVLATRLRCAGCGAERSLLRLVSSLPARDRVCRDCRGRMVASGFDQCQRVAQDTLARAMLRRSLASVGARAGDVITVRAGAATRRMELTVPAGTSSAAEAGS